MQDSHNRLLAMGCCPTGLLTAHVAATLVRLAPDPHASVCDVALPKKLLINRPTTLSGYVS
ncbi:hypothetical protein HJFPF1_06142 [Paramyrothecium foliicola]|nr:hypothetical protein HJFPF1_06142 [Paramyrothecium foliicola]